MSAKRSKLQPRLSENKLGIRPPLRTREDWTQQSTWIASKRKPRLSYNTFQDSSMQSFNRYSNSYSDYLSGCIFQSPMTWYKQTITIKKWCWIFFNLVTIDYNNYTSINLSCRPAVFVRPGLIHACVPKNSFLSEKAELLHVSERREQRLLAPSLGCSVINH